MKNIFGQWRDPRGNVAASGRLHLKLNQDAVIYSIAQAAPREVSFALDRNGALFPDARLWANDELKPAGTYYTTTVTEAGGGVIWGPQQFMISGLEPINLGGIVPGAIISEPSTTTGVGVNTLNLVSDNVFGQPQPGQLVLIHTVAFQSIFPQNFSGPTSYASAGHATTAPAVYVVTLTGANVGTITFTPSGSIIFQTAGFIANPGQRMTIIAPDPMDATLSDVAISLAYTRSS
jgi:hypothetical protein